MTDCSHMKHSNILYIRYTLDPKGMRPEEVVVMKVLRFVLVAAFAAALVWMAYSG